jgi:hypothetical protein
MAYGREAKAQEQIRQGLKKRGIEVTEVVEKALEIGNLKNLRDLKRKIESWDIEDLKAFLEKVEEEYRQEKEQTGEQEKEEKEKIEVEETAEIEDKDQKKRVQARIRMQRKREREKDQGKTINTKLSEKAFKKLKSYAEKENESYEKILSDILEGYLTKANLKAFRDKGKAKMRAAVKKVK